MRVLDAFRVWVQARVVHHLGRTSRSSRRNWMTSEMSASVNNSARFQLVFCLVACRSSERIRLLAARRSPCSFFNFSALQRTTDFVSIGPSSTALPEACSRAGRLCVGGVVSSTTAARRGVVGAVSSPTCSLAASAADMAEISETLAKGLAD